MKKFVFAFTVIFLLCGCVKNDSTSGTQTEMVPMDYGKVIEIAKEELKNVFSEHKSFEIQETSTMVRADDENQMIIQFKYESENGRGIYGFEYEKNQSGNFILLQQGENITIDHLLK